MGRERGRTVASTGYVLIRVGVDHHLADVRGYAYEHRIVAESKLGRRLSENEVVHHINGIKADNRPENLAVVASAAEHSLLHRKSGLHLRMPGEGNPLVTCGCGCGQEFARYDGEGRPRDYVSGHNPPSSPNIDMILRALASGPKQIQELMSLHRSGRIVKTTCSKLVKEGRIIRTGRGMYMAIKGEG